MTGAGHIPVLADAVVAALAPRAGGTYVDGTFGGGGYARALLDAADCAVLGIDRDPDAIDRGRELERRYAGRLSLVHGRFGDLARLVHDAGAEPVDGVTFDIGVSSMQLDEADRGFSFRQDGPLDMRMSLAGPSAADIVNETPERDLADLIYTYGEERRARRVAKAIVTARADAPITRTGRLAEIVRAAIPASPKGDAIDPATRTFQALRIAVNEELDELGRGLDGAEAVLAPGGRLAVVSFHSLEDRIVKSFLKARSDAAPRGSRHRPDPGPGLAPTFRLLFRRPVTPGGEEIRVNPRARSARLRAAERTDAPVPDTPARDEGGPRR
jgi:16S rRNA (cytosine1402-N4)-methyltransferase